MNAVSEGVRKRLSRQTLVHHFLEVSAETFPEKIALIHEDMRIPFARINRQANQMALWLRNQGVLPGDRVGLILDNGIEYAVSYYGTLKAGGVAVPFSNDVKPDGLRYLLGELGPKVIISSAKFEPVLHKTGIESFPVNALLLKNPRTRWEEGPPAFFSWDSLFENQEESPNLGLPISEMDLASIIYTSGSTGKPKGVMLSHRNIVANVHSICQYLNLTETDIQMVVQPFFYVMGKSLLNTHFAVGGSVVINNKFAYPAAVVEQMISEQVTGFSGVPSTYTHLLHNSPLASVRAQLKSLRYCSQAGGHMPRPIKEELRKALPDHTEIFIMYGATEAAARLSYLEPGRFADKIDSIGKAIPGVTLRVLDAEGKELPVGEVGELVGSGDNIMKGYWKDPEATAKALDQNGYHTGDLCFQDKDGFFFLVGRKDNLLKVGGHRISPQEIEDTLMETKLFQEVVVLGAPGPAPRK